MFKRNRFAWSINEILSLEREYELLGLTIDQIAEKHQRTPRAIMFKLHQEGLEDHDVLFSNYYSAEVPENNIKLDINLDSNLDNNIDSDIDNLSD